MPSEDVIEQRNYENNKLLTINKYLKVPRFKTKFRGD